MIAAKKCSGGSSPLPRWPWITPLFLSRLNSKMRANSIRLPSPARRSAMSAFDRLKKRSGRHAAALCRDGITARVSYRFNFFDRTGLP
jgi:hypothetical protein